MADLKQERYKAKTRKHQARNAQIGQFAPPSLDGLHAKDVAGPGAFSKLNENYARNLTTIQKKHLPSAASMGASGGRKSPTHMQAIQQKLLALHMQHAPSSKAAARAALPQVVAGLHSM